MNKSIFRLLLPVVIFCAFFSLLIMNAIGQCGGVYFKPSTYKIFNEKVTNYNFSEMTGDGKIDLLGYSADDYYYTKRVYIYPNDGSGNFGEPKILTFPAQTKNSFEPRIVDFNSDGKNDFVALLDTNPISIFVFLNDGNANFTAQPPIVFTDGESLVNIVDVNGDGRKDFISNVFSPSGYRYRLTNTDGTLGAPVQLASALYAFAADFNGDGKVDFPVVAGSGSSYQLKFYYNLGNGIFALGGNSIELGLNNVLIDVKDFNNDGKPDLLFGTQLNSALPALSILTNSGNENFSVFSTTVPGNNPMTGDYNGDGLTDILTAETGRYTILVNSGSVGGFSPRTYNGSIRGIVKFDLDGDGKSDSVSFSPYNTDLSRPGKVFTGESQITISKNVCNRVGQTKIIDFDGDGLNDFAFWNQNTGRWRYQKRLYQAGDSITYQWGQAGDIPVPGDYDGDGKTDYAVFRPSNGVWYVVQSENSAPFGVQFGASEDKPVPGDYNGDGKTDFAVFRPSNGYWYILYGGSYQFSAVQFGASEDKPVPEDYDGDGKIDVAVFRPSNGFWYVLQSSNNSYFGVQWGTNTDLLVPADFDGDGKADIAVLRPGATDYTYIRRSNGMPPVGYPFGTNGDIPQISDWDGNGFAEIGLYRPSNRTWYLLPVPLFDSVRNAGAESGEQLISSTIRTY